jgi:L-proline amide hydrolase
LTRGNVIQSKRRKATLLVLCAILLLAVAYSVKSFTPPMFAENSIAELRSLIVNGDEQFLLIRGTDRNLPVVLFLHGGPGMPAMYLAHDFQRELEKHFVVVHWDQRASGKSFKTDSDPGKLSTSALLSDTDVVVDFLLDQFGTDRLWLVGHSHGAYLGVLYARRNDEKVCAYVGIGQVTNDGLSGPVTALQRRFLEDRREELGLEPDTVIGDSNLESLLFRSGSELYGETSFAPLLLSGLMAPEYSLFDILNVAKGSAFSSRNMRYDLPRDLLTHEWQFNIPVALVMGRHDMVTPTELAREYFDRLEAPLKAWYQIEEAAHFPHFEKPKRFAATMSELKEAWGDCPRMVTGKL